MWDLLLNIFGVRLAGGFEAVAKWWICGKRHAVFNTCTSAVLWCICNLLLCIWNLRNAFYFQGEWWSDVKKVMRKMVAVFRRWECLCKEGNALRLGKVVAQIEAIIREPLRIMREPSCSSAALPTTSWESSPGSQVPSSSSGVPPMHEAVVVAISDS
jgi:hypothetical protein